MWTNAAIFYAVAGVLVGTTVCAMDRVHADFWGKPFRYPRLLAFVVAGVAWPLVVFKMVTGR